MQVKHFVRARFCLPRFTAIAVSFLILCPARVFGQSFSAIPRADIWVPDGPVNAMVVLSNTLYMGGQFQSLRRNPQTTGILLDFATLTRDPVFPPVQGVVRALAADGAGGFYIGGSFTSVGGVARTNLACVDRNGVVTDWNPYTDGAVLALAFGKGTIYVGGEFSTIAGQPFAHLASVDVGTGSATSWDPAPDQPVRALAISGPTLYAAGDFLNVGNTPRQYLAAWDTRNGSLLPWNPNPQGGAVAAIEVLGNTVFIGGAFNTIGGEPRYGLAAVNGATGVAFPWNPSGTNYGNSISAMALKGTTLYAAGNFLRIGGQIRRGVCALSVDTALALDWNPVVSDPASTEFTSIAASGDTVFLGGTFTNVNGISRKNFVALDSQSAAVRTSSVNVLVPPTAIGISLRNVYLGGVALDTGVARRNLAAIDLDSGQLASWNPGCDGPVLTMLAASNRIYVGGVFTNVGGSLHPNLASVNATTGLSDSSWNPFPNGAVLSLAPSPTGGSNIFAGGQFTVIGGQFRSHIAALDGSGTATAWNPGADAPVVALAAAADGSPVIYAGGSFSNLAGVARAHLGAVNESSGAAVTGNFDTDGTVNALAAAGSGVYVGGDFQTIAGWPQPYLAFITQNGADTNWSPVLSGSASSLATTTNRVYVGGAFDSVDGQSSDGLAALDRTNAAVVVWNWSGGIKVISVIATSNAVCAGGAFAGVSDRFAPGLAVFGSDRAPAITVQPRGQRVFLGSHVTLSVGATGESPLRYQWSWYGAPIPGKTNAMLDLGNVVTNTGDYSVQVLNDFGSVWSETASVIPEFPPSVLIQPTNLSVSAGTTATLSLLASGMPAPQIFWRRNGMLLGAHSGSSLIFSNAQPSDGGRYDAIVMNAAGSVFSTGAVLRVIPLSAIGLSDDRSNAVLSVVANGFAAGNNSTATFEVNEPLHAGLPGGKSIWMTWMAPSNGLARFDTLGSDFDTLIAVYTQANDGSLVPVCGDDDSAGYGSSLAVFNAAAGQVYHVAVDGLSGATGNVMLAWRIEPSVHIPTITQSPTNTVVPFGSNAVFSVVASHPENLPLNYQWFHGGNPIEGATSATLLITNANTNDLGEYTVMIRDDDCADPAIQSDWAFLELSSAPNVHRDVKFAALSFRDASTLSGTSLINSRRLVTEREEGASACNFLFPGTGVGNGNAPGEVVWVPTGGTNSTTSSRTTFIPKTSSSLPESRCGYALWPEFQFGIHADIPGRLFLRTRGAAVILSAVGWYNNAPHVLNPVACSESTDLNTEALTYINLEQNSNYMYSIVNPKGSTLPEGSLATITEDRILCPRPSVAGYVVTQPTDGFQPFQYVNGGVLLSAQVVEVDSLCQQSLLWLQDGVPIHGATTASLLVTNTQAFARYSLVVSNCAGAVTNVVGTLIRLEVYRDGPGDETKLGSLPLIPDVFLIEAATNLSGPPEWSPFFTNKPGHQLPVVLPSATVSNLFFRARPVPPG